MIRSLADKGFHGGNHGGDTALHIRSATAIQVATPDYRDERITAPCVLVTGGNHISMSDERQDRIATAVAQPEILHISRVQVCRHTALALQTVSDQFLAARVFWGEGSTIYKL